MAELDEDWALSVEIQETKFLMGLDKNPETFTLDKIKKSLELCAEPQTNIDNTLSVKLFEGLKVAEPDNDFQASSPSQASTQSTVKYQNQENSLPSNMSQPIVPVNQCQAGDVVQSLTSRSFAPVHKTHPQTVSIQPFPVGAHPVQFLLDYIRLKNLPYPSYYYDMSSPHLGITVTVSCGSISQTCTRSNKKAAKADASAMLVDTLVTLSQDEVNELRNKQMSSLIAGGVTQTTSLGVTQPIPAQPLLGQGALDSGEDKIKAEEISLINKHLNTVLTECCSDTIAVQRKDPNSPLYSCTSFEQLNLPLDLLKGVYAMGYNQPSKIQETALPLLLGNPPQNIIAQSQSGTGKTAAFAIALLSKIDSTKKYPQAIVLSPTYELAQQTGKVIEQLGLYCTDIRCAYAVRGTCLPRGSKLQEQVVIGTPGTMLDWALKLKFFDPKLVRVFILDEADVMIDAQGHQDQSIRIHRLLNKENTLHMLFSATYTPAVISFAETVIPNPVVIRLLREEQSVDNIRAFYIPCQSVDDKFEALVNIYGSITIGQAIIFCRTRKDAGWLAEKLRKEGHLVGLLSGELDIERRAEVINRFRRGNEKILISTNVSARGIDVAQVTVVVNFDVPSHVRTGDPDFETYLHRIGRTGRFGKKGIALTMVEGSRDIENIKKIEQHFGRPIKLLNARDMDELEKLES